MRYESLNKNSNPTKSYPTMNTSIMNPLPADNAGIIGMLKELIRSVSTEVFHELIEELRPSQRQENQVEDSDHLGVKGALDFLNSRGYKISNAQLYKLTSKSEIPYQKFDGSNRLHFYKSQLEEWVRTKLIDGNAIGILEPSDSKKKGGKR